MDGDDADSSGQGPKAVSTYDRVLYWILCTPGLLVILYATYLMGHAFIVLMPSGRPTAGSLTLGAGVVLLIVGLLIYGGGRLLGRGLLQR